jgi:hypothetical protein
VAVPLLVQNLAANAAACEFFLQRLGLILVVSSVPFLHPGLPRQTRLEITAALCRTCIIPWTSSHI